MKPLARQIALFGAVTIGLTAATAAMPQSPVSTYVLERTIPVPGAGLAVSFASDGPLAAYQENHRTRVIRLTTGNEVASYEDTGPVSAFSPDGHLLAVAGKSDGTMRVREVVTGRQVSVATSKPRAVNLPGIDQIPATNFAIPLPVLSAAFSPDGRMLAAGGLTGASVFDTTTGNQLWSPTSAAVGLEAVAFGPAGRLAVSGADGSVTRWDTVSRGSPLILRRPAPAGSRPCICAIAYSADGNWIVAGNLDTGVAIWQMRGDGTPATVPLDFPKHVRALALSSPTSDLILGDDDGDVTVWDVSTGRRLGRLTPSANATAGPANTNAILSLRVSPDGRLLVVGTKTAIQVWRRETGTGEHL